MDSSSSTVSNPPLTTLTITTLTDTTELPVWTVLVTSTECYTYTTIATRGHTVSVESPSPLTSHTSRTSAAPTTKFDPTIVTLAPTVTQTVTDTEVVLILESFYQDPFSTVTLQITPSGPVSPSTIGEYPGQLVYVVDSGPHGWESWSHGAKVGFIVGVVCAAIMLAWLLFCLFKRIQSGLLMTGDGRGMLKEVQVLEPMPPPTVGVHGPLNPALATPYGYGFQPGVFPQQYPGWGMRGGDARKESKSKRLAQRFENLKENNLREDEEFHGNENLAAGGKQETGDELEENESMLRERHNQMPAFYRPPVPRAKGVVQDLKDRQLESSMRR